MRKGDLSLEPRDAGVAAGVVVIITGTTARSFVAESPASLSHKSRCSTFIVAAASDCRSSSVTNGGTIVVVVVTVLLFSVVAADSRTSLHRAQRRSIVEFRRDCAVLAIEAELCHVLEDEDELQKLAKLE
jgi:hypothetical protein